ncbi:MAG: VanW family protein [Patescibacteria group bacterium]|nr:VanW family protein [Patescibacteria group bacterium]
MSFKQSAGLWIKGCAFALAISIIIFTGVFSLYYQNKIFQGISIDGIEVGGLTKEETLEKLSKEPLHKTLGFLQISAQGVEKKATLPSVITGRNYQKTIDLAFKKGRNGSIFHRCIEIANLVWHPQNLESQQKIDLATMQKLVDELKLAVDRSPIQPSVSLGRSNDFSSFNLTAGRDGLSLNSEKTLEKTLVVLQQKIDASYFDQQSTLVIEVVLDEIKAQLTAEEQKTTIQKVKNILGKELVFTNEPQAENLEGELFTNNSPNKISVTLNDQQITSLIAPPDEFSSDEARSLVQDWSKLINGKPIGAVFEFDPKTLEVETFQAPQPGFVLDEKETAKKLISLLPQVEKSSETTLQGKLIVIQKDPEIALDKTNDLGINELIGFGDSYYQHSITSRIHNVNITANKLSLHIVKPDEKFSFNKTIGEISSNTGYKPAYIIKDRRTILGDGGGVCQVSTTLFRALLDAGLDITKRLPHSYRVSYYELDRKPGFDATVYAGDVDLRFINDTNHHLLIHSTADSQNLYMKVEIYGTKDGRTTQISNYQQWGYRPPPAPEYIPDQSLAPGQTKQIDWSTSGIKASFDWIVKDAENNVIREKTYYSSYRPWSAKYLQGV